MQAMPEHFNGKWKFREYPILQCPSGDEELFPTKSVVNMQLKQWKGVLHLAYHVVFPLTIEQRPLSQRVWAEGTTLGQNWRPDAHVVPPFIFLSAGWIDHTVCGG